MNNPEDWVEKKRDTSIDMTLEEGLSGEVAFMLRCKGMKEPARQTV